MKISQLKTAIIMLLVVLGIALNAQEKETKDKLDNLKGKVEKVTIKVDGKEVVFEGKEAERIAKAAKAANGSKAFVFTMDENDLLSPCKKKRVKIFKSDGDSCSGVCSSDETELKPDRKNKEVKVKIIDGAKSVTVTTKKDGREETKTYTGEEAEKFIEENGADGKVKVMVKKLGDEESACKDHLIHFNKRIGDNCCKCCCISSCCKSSEKQIKCSSGDKGNIKWKVKCDDSNEKEVHIILEKKKDVKNSK